MRAAARPRAASWLVGGLLAGVVAHNLWASWLRWGDLVVDCGRELEVPRLLAAGRTLYVDVRSYYPPLAAWVNAALFTLAGADVGVLMVAGTVSAVAMAGVLLALVRRFAPRSAGVLVAGAFCYCCAFAHLYTNPIFNWVLPYSYGATYGMLAAAASLLLLVRHAQDGDARALSLSVACLALASLAKLEAFIPAAGAHLAFVLLARPRLGRYLIAAVVVGAVWARYAAVLGWDLVGDYLWVATSPESATVAARHMGAWGEALPRLGRSALALGGALTGLVVAALVDRSGAEGARWRGLLGVATAGIAAAAISRVDVFDQLRLLPAVLAVLLVGRMVRWWRTPSARTEALPRLLLLVFALGALVRTPLSTGAFHYGFYLLPVPLAAFGVAWFADLPRWLPGRSRRLVGWAGGGLFVALAATHFVESRSLYARHTTRVEAPRGRMILLDGFGGFPRGAAHAETVRVLARHPPASRVLAVPQGAGFAFLAGLESACGMTSFMPNEFGGPFEGRLLACLARDPPELVVVVNQNLEEYGVRGFGLDYALDTAAWIEAHYVPVARPGGSGVIVVLARRSAVDPGRGGH